MGDNLGYMGLVWWDQFPHKKRYWWTLPICPSLACLLPDPVLTSLLCCVSQGVIIRGCVSWVPGSSGHDQVQPSSSTGRSLEGGEREKLSCFSFFLSVCINSFVSPKVPASSTQPTTSQPPTGDRAPGLSKPHFLPLSWVGSSFCCH